MLTQEVAVVHTPSAFLACERGERAFLLDGRGHRSWGDGCAVFGADPAATLTIRAEDAAVESPLQCLQRFVDGNFQRGCAGILVALSYDLKHWIENLPRRLPWPAVPIVYAAAYDWYVRAGYRDGRVVVAAVDDAALRTARARLRALPHVDPASAAVVQVWPSMRRDEYVAMVERTKAYIAAGDIYQANLSQAFRASLPEGSGRELFLRWTEAYPAPYAAYVDGGAWQILGNSPECLIDRDGPAIATMPIKGTRRVDDGQDVAALAAELAADAKDRAEHLMIVDLERNDLGRICVAGSIDVSVFQRVREFPLLLHMESTVSGTLRETAGIAEIITAMFPGGSITGAPKIRAMEIIEELEPEPRGFYTGSVGWLEPGGRCRFNISIRTAVLDGNGLSFHTGGGIVADSDPQREYDETFAKAQSLLRVLAGAARMDGCAARG